MVGGCLAAASANAINCVLDRDIDEQMRRTRRRPLPRHAVAAAAAAVFGLVLGVARRCGWASSSTGCRRAWRWGRTPSTSSSTPCWLKRRTSQNIVWGGIAGCFPPLIGWTAVTGSVAWPPFVLFAIVFFWTPPHTWALAFRYREDYAAAGVPMLPVVRSAPAVGGRILVYSVVTVAVSLAAVAGRRHRLALPGRGRRTGAALIGESVALWRRARAGLTGRGADARCGCSTGRNSYLALVFVAAAVDPLLR